MQQGYNSAFARVYNLWWADFARDAAPRLLDLYYGDSGEVDGGGRGDASGKWW